MYKKIYFDNAATTKVFPEVIRFTASISGYLFGNASSIHSSGEKVKHAVNEAREKIAGYLNVSQGSIFFTPGGTISNYIAIMGYIRKGMRLITCQTEHPSVLYNIKKACEIYNAECIILPVDKNGILNLEELEKAVAGCNCFVSIMQVNNETGVIQPLKDISRIIKKNPESIFHVDGIQGFGKVNIDLKELQIDSYSISSHKINGNMGAAGLYIKDLERLHPVISGGPQEGGVCPGTENAVAICGFAMACEKTFDNFDDTRKLVIKLNDKLRKGISNLPYGAVVNTPENSSPYILNISLKNKDSKNVVKRLNEENICISSKSACSCKNPAPSHVLKAMGMSDEEALSAIRVSFGYDNTISDVNDLLEALKCC